MDAVKFSEEARRRFKVTGKATSVLLESLDPEGIVKEVEEWAAENPIKTRQSVFLKQWPNAEIDCQGVIAIDPCDIDKTARGKSGNCYHDDCDECRLDFWLKEVK